MVTIKIPALPRGLFANLLGLAGLVAMIVAVGGLTHNWWWTLLAAGIVSVGLSYIAHLNGVAAAEPAGEPAGDVERTQALPRLAARSA